VYQNTRGHPNFFLSRRVANKLLQKEYFEYETEYVAEVEANNVKQQEST
jgi:hypothetical protein